MAKLVKEKPKEFRCGHPRTKDNVRKDSRGNDNCIICIRRRWNRWRDKNGIRKSIEADPKVTVVPVTKIPPATNFRVPPDYWPAQIRRAQLLDDGMTLRVAYPAGAIIANIKSHIYRIARKLGTRVTVVLSDALYIREIRTKGKPKS